MKPPASMDVAYLLTAYHQPGHLARLVRALGGPSARFFIHVDGKKDIAPFQGAVGSLPGVTLLEGADRIVCHWGGFGLVQAVLNLIACATATGRKFDRFCLLSGSDYPVRPASEIVEALSSDREFLSVDRPLGTSGEGLIDQRAKYFYFRDRPLLARLKLSGRLPRWGECPVPLYHGTSWWCLTGDAVRWVMTFIGRTPAYVRFMQHVDIPDEVFFHSLIKASPFAPNLSHDFERARDGKSHHADNVHGCHYIVWRGREPHPRVLTREDFDAIRRSSALFARKFEEGASADLLELLDRPDR